MRLTCPNCGAIYEVPDNVIPEEGRDVQCSNCATTWFQQSAAALAALEAEADMAPMPPAVTPEPVSEPDPEPTSQPEEESPEVAAASEPEPAPEPEPEHEPDPEPEPEPEATAEPAPEEDAPAETELSPEELLDQMALDEEDTPEEAPQRPAAPQRRELDPAVREVLRQEAEYETKRRLGAVEPLESQPDLGLDQPERKRIVPADIPSLREKEAREAAIADGHAFPEDEEAEAAETEHKSRRDLLPDIEDINSTLRKREVRSVPTPGELMEDPEEANASGFRAGFFLAVIVAVIMAMFYVKADDLTIAMPNMASTISDYVEGIDSARFWLDQKTRGVAGWLDSLSSEGGAEG